MNNSRLTTLDFLISVAERRVRPLNFALILQLRNALTVENLKTGARSARFLFPTTGSYVLERRWVHTQKPEAGIEVISANDNEEIERFLDRPFDPTKTFPVEQLLVINGEGEARKLVTRFHHIAADGLSAAMWLRHQFRVAQGLEEGRKENEVHKAPTLREHPAPIRRSVFAFEGRSEQLWCRDNAPSHTRRWKTFQFNAALLRKRCRKAGGFTYNDLLAASLLEVLARWNKEHGVKHARNVSLWFPVNIRDRPMSGFGNGTSRIRIYAQNGDSLSLADKCRAVRRQLSWSIRNGEWAVPPNPPLAQWPLWTVKPLLRSYLSRPSVDMCTSVFSHVERLGTPDEPAFDNVDEVESVGPLHKSHCLAVNGATLHGRTSLTFTYDPNLLTSADVDHLIELYEQQIDQALREL
jgi:hypothetical protein